MIVLWVVNAKIDSFYTQNVEIKFIKVEKWITLEQTEQKKDTNKYPFSKLILQTRSAFEI